MAKISLQSGIVYGPVFSRRLGRSFGINLLPKSYKSCSFDCIYCQYGPTKNVTLSPKFEDLPTIAQVLAAVEKALMKPRTMDVLTFSGNGEPTLHPDFQEIVQGVSAIRDRLRPNVKLALLSNSSKVMDPEVKKAIEQIEIPMMKLDAGEDQTFHVINQPESSLHLTDIIKGLKEIPDLIIQSLLIDGEISNIKGESFQSWVDVLMDINPRELHIYSTERPTAKDDLVRVSARKLAQIEGLLINKYDLRAHAFWSDKMTANGKVSFAQEMPCGYNQNILGGWICTLFHL